ncbi:hypothetical protein [Adhaeribacter aquaticus]|uniref:hypothetical protein n=1 Tax=Adhaeribacter aquaticus TaxID=299567 RepID=UPI000478B557|nr:hypothetical protein [Adhaeribacter aquaticus]
MKISIHTTVGQDFQTVFYNFDRELFLYLAPPYPKLKLLRFDGTEPGDLVAVELDFVLFRQYFASFILDRKESEKAAYFIDLGQNLPWPLRYWQHKHLITEHNGGAVISDLIEYKTFSKIIDWLIYPFMYVQFARRKAIYKSVFN